jgi:group I intron endonuclease
MIVYVAKNIVNGKKYIGYTTKTLDERIKSHLSKSKYSTNKHYFYLFKNAIRKYGINSFEWDILVNCSSIDECSNWEKFYIKEFNTISPHGYNLTEGGNGGIQSEETKIKISESVTKFWNENKEKHHWYNLDNQKRSEWATKSWKIKKDKGYIPPKGFIRSEDSKLKMSETKNELNKVKWLNVSTGEEKYLSSTKMSEYTKLSVGVFNHLKNGRQIKTKCGWTYIPN